MEATRELFHDMSGEVVQLVWASDFWRFIAALPTEIGKSDHYSLFSLIERWMDTTHTFHTWVGELTISSMRFSAIIGIAFRGIPVPFDISYYNLSEGAKGQYVCDLLGFMLTWKNRKNVMLSSFVKSFRRLPTTTPCQIIQKVRCFLLILLGTTLFCETGHEASIVLLGPFRDLDWVATFYWGSAALAYLYYRLDTVCKGTVMICGFWHVLYVCISIPFSTFLSLTLFPFTYLFPFIYGVSRSNSSATSVLLALIGVSLWYRDGALLAYLALDMTCRLIESSWTPWSGIW